MRSIYAHELGHLILDSIKTELWQEIEINKFHVKYINPADDTFPFTGYVEVSPKYKAQDISSDPKKTFLSILSLSSGCIFQSEYERIAFDSNSEFSDCWSLAPNAIGKGDFGEAGALASEFRRANKFSKSYTNKLLKLEFDIASKHSRFIRGMQQLIIEFSEIVEKQSADFESYFDECKEITLQGESLKQLIDQIKELNGYNEYYRFVKRNLNTFLFCARVSQYIAKLG